MLLDPVIKRRFVELEEGAQAVLRTQEDVDLQTYVNKALAIGWATSVASLIERTFGRESLQCRTFTENMSKLSHAKDHFDICHAVFKAARDDYEGGYLFSVRALVKAEASMDALDQAGEFLASGYKDAACIFAGVALEIAMRELCTRNGIQHDKHTKLHQMNTALTNKAYNAGVQGQVETWAYWRNKAAHGEWDQYEEGDVRGMIEGVTRFVGTYLR